ncbi:hypothetical protein LOTGIDRAFT_173949 [Lottia gigantea]|uniref:TIR domain-containing protein n=1 Tax=Lottia gigantea TaxID=225164 RepID=V4AVJ0_LOTGI|nr:hypothetical protein LOTGIDRAFT_173949 [Lottia gigantea]ESO99070.1 hypothetical protein LOTGIDRAFT_173949 [Lottia gigantea]
MELKAQITMGTLDPCLFESDLVGKARDHKAPFLQCRKYFHTISMAQLEEILPSDGTTDFDAHLQRSIIMMQELNTEMSKDVTILYSAKDMPSRGKSGDDIDPTRINNDLENAGYSCWFNADMNTVGVNELTLALKNCKVVLALVSDNFEKDERCRDLLLYAIDGLTKQYIIAPIGNRFSWQQTDLGMRIGKQEQMIMFKSGARYNEKIKELIIAVKDKLKGLEKTELVDYPECFLSYCWSNSHDAVAKGTKSTAGSLGHYDPRKIKEYLSDNGINVWLDCEQTTVNKGLYDNICKGLGHSKVVVACVSDEYINSVNCMMELRFAVLTLKLPLVIVVVGTGKEWKRSEQRSKSSEVYLQQQNDSALETLVTFVKERMPSAAEKLKQEAQNVKKNVTEIQQKAVKQSTNISYQEERELMQRKFMRHIISFMSRLDQTPMPRLILIDLEKQQKNSNKSRNTVESSFSKMSKLGSRPKTASKSKDIIQVITVKAILMIFIYSVISVKAILMIFIYSVITGESDIDDIWDEEGLCIKMLCEYEEGWHLCQKSLSFKRSDSNKEQLKKMSPYLARLYALARQSHVNLNCFVSNSGQDFINWIEQESMEHTEFLQGFQTLRSILVEDDSTESTDFQEQLVRCHLPSGKVYWLCDKHQKMPRITKLTNRTGGNTSSFKNLYQEDILLKEVMEQSNLYKKKKSEKKTVQKIDLPDSKFCCLAT